MCVKPQTGKVNYRKDEKLATVFLPCGKKERGFTMIDKSWMLNPQAIRHAKTCIQIIKERTNQKLKLSQADFFQRLEHNAKTIRSVEFIAAHHQLMSMADNTQQGGKANAGKVVSLFGKKSQLQATVAKSVESIETVAYGGKHYPKWHDGKIFHGIYRGQPLYH